MAERTRQLLLHIPLSLIIDLVNHLYIFSEGKEELDEDFARLFTISHTPAESGPWWRFAYGAGFHMALHQIAHRVKELPEEVLSDGGSELSREEALHFLPYLEEVERILSVWRHPTLPTYEKKRRIAALFSEEIARVLITPKGSLLLNQFYEEGMAMRRCGINDFFTYLDSCPLPEANMSSVNLRQAIAYWAWMDNVKACRTFANEEGTKNPRVVRMQQAVLFYRLVERLPQRKIDFSTISLKLTPYWFSFLLTQDLSLLALVADSYGRNPWFNYYDQVVFIEHTTLGDAFRALQSHICIRQEYNEADFAQKYKLLLKATAMNIMNQQEILQERALMYRCRSVDPLLIAKRLMEQAEMINKTRTSHSACAVEGTGSFQDILDLLETARYVTNRIAESDPLSQHASAGLLFILKQMKGEMSAAEASLLQTAST